MPEWFLKEPAIYPGDEFYLTAFYNLSSDRYIGEIQGPIPWTSMVHYADRKGLDGDVADAFEFIIRKIDSAYLEWNKPSKPLKRTIK